MKILLNLIQSGSNPRHFPEASLAKVSSNTLTAKTQWHFSILMLLDLCTEFDTADNQLHNSLFLASGPLSSFSLPLNSSALETLHPPPHPQLPLATGLPHCFMYSASLMAKARLYSCRNPGGLGSACKIAWEQKEMFVEWMHVSPRSVFIFASVLGAASGRKTSCMTNLY